MELDYLRYVTKLAKCLHFSKAAAELSISQPTLSQRLVQIEDEFGVKLFERNTRSITLTAAGEEFITHAEKVLTAYEQLSAAMNKNSVAHKGALHIGILLNMAGLDVHSKILAFQRQHPQIQLTITEVLGSIELVRLLEAEVFDVVFLIPAPKLKLAEQTKVYPIFKGHVVAIVPQNHRLAGCESIALQELANENLIFPVKEHSLFGTVMAECRSNGFEPKIVAQTCHATTSIKLSARNVGIALLSSPFVNLYAFEGVSAIPIAPVISRDIVMAYANHAPNSSVVKIFRDYISHEINVLEA